VFINLKIQNTMTLIKYNKPAGVRGVTPVFNQLFNDMFEGFANTGLRGLPTTNIPSVNVAESDTLFTLELSAPGFSKEEISISIEEDNLVISGEKKSEKEESTKKYTRKEFSQQNFQRSFSLPETVAQENIVARFENGVLFLDLPKKQVEEKAGRKIQLQ
jgi:HSP20 family protein